MQTQTPRRAEDYLQDLQANIRVASPVSHVLQEGRADIHQVLREHYTLPESLPSSDRDQGYATSSNSEVYAPGLYSEVGDGVPPMPGEAGQYQEAGPPHYQLNADGLMEPSSAAPQEARTRHRLSQFTTTTPRASASPSSSGPVTPDTPGSDRSGYKSRSSRAGSARNVSVHYASVSVTNGVQTPADDQPPPPTCAVPHCVTSHTSETRMVRFYSDTVPLYCQAHPNNVRSVPELPNLGLEMQQGQGHRSRRVPAAALALPDDQKMNPISRPPNHVHLRSVQPGTSNERTYPRSQSFEGRPGALSPQAPHQRGVAGGVAGGVPGSVVGRSRDAESIATHGRGHGHGAGRGFPYGQYEEDDRCSTCSSSSSSDDWGYNWYDWPRPPGAKISYVDDMGIGGMTARGHSTLPGRGRRHKKNKNCVIS
jgi:hypothetical protein